VTDSKRCGYAAILGRPNVGKSTLLNTMLSQKVSITSRKPQTTRHRLLGIKTTDLIQVLYVDTPGIHGDEPRAINRYMNRSAKSAIRDVDAIVFLLDRTEWNSDDQLVADSIAGSKARVFIAVNKIDQIKNKRVLLPQLSRIQKLVPEAEIIPISAVTGENVQELESLVEAAMPTSPFYYPDDQVTDRSERFLVAEIIREKLMRQLGDEIPYALTIQIDNFKWKKTTIHIEATIFVERDGQKAILIGKKGKKLKQIGSEARSDMEGLLEAKVMLTTWVKVKTGWSNDDRALKSLGYDDA
jgi:GTP-binding protein Era